MATTANINELLDGHTRLTVDCLDRIYLNAYVPNLQVGGQVVQFLTQHRGNPVPSPALFEKIGARFREAVKQFAQDGAIPMLPLKKPDRRRWDDRKLDHVQPYFARATAPGVVAIVVAQEFQQVFVGRNCAKEPGAVRFDFQKTARRVTNYYFYILDNEFGPGFIKLCTYFPYPGKVWLNGHEWAKRKAKAAGLEYQELANGFASCSAPNKLQEICDALGPEQIQAFVDRWMAIIPTPLDEGDRAGGYWWELSMRQIEVARTIVLDDPRRARGFFESLVRDNIGMGRPTLITAVFGRQLRKDAPGIFRTRVFGVGTEVKIDFAFRHSRIKQYLKEGRAVRVESVINSPDDLNVARRLCHLPELQEKARAANQRLLNMERAGQGCAIGTALFERIQQPYVREGQRTGALRFGDPRVMALTGALSVLLCSVIGVNNQRLRCLVAELLGAKYTASQMSYDLRRLRLHGIIQRFPHSQTYVLTDEGMRVALFYTKVRDRILPPLLEADQPHAPPELRAALATIRRAVNDRVADAHLGTAA